MYGNIEFTQNSKTKFNDSKKDTHGFIVNEIYDEKGENENKFEFSI